MCFNPFCEGKIFDIKIFNFLNDLEDFFGLTGNILFD